MRKVKDNSNKKFLFETALVTGIGGDIGLGIAKILKKSKVVKRIIGSDIHENHPGNYLTDKSIVIERADSINYIESLKDCIKRYSIDLIIPTSEPEIRTLFKKNIIKNIDNVPILLPNKKSLEIGLDKYTTYLFLKTNELPYPWTIKVNEGLPLETPCIIKERKGAGSVNINIVHEEFVNFYSKTKSDDIWQELLLPTDQEYTCGLYGIKSGEIRMIVFNRVLRGGISVYGETVDIPEINEVLLKLGKRLQLKGSINVQLRLTEKGPIIFEINPRFSSTVVFRHLLGFEDLIWSLYEQNDLSLEDYHPPKKGSKFFRTSKEYIL